MCSQEYVLNIVITIMAQENTETVVVNLAMVMSVKVIYLPIVSALCMYVCMHICMESNVI